MSLFKKNTKQSDNTSDHSKLNQQILTGMSKSRIPSFKQLKYIGKYLNKKETITFVSAISIFAISLIVVASTFYTNHLEIAPVQGGSYIEGTTGSPKYINPLYSSINAVDSDLSKLIFSSLFTRDQYGYLSKDLVKKYEIGPNQKTYTITIRDDVQWHNGDDLTADDVVFTFSTLKTSQYGSPLRHTFNGVEIERVDDYVVKFILKESYAPFMELLTFGIIPAHTWQGVTPSNIGLAELNIKPIGSGPYKFLSLTKDKSGNIKEYNLIVNNNYYNNKPYIEEITFKFFVNTFEAVSALNNGSIDTLSYLPNENEEDIKAQSSFNLHRISLPQITGLFFNLKNNTVSNKKIRQALALAINKEKVVTDLFSDKAETVYGPMLSNNFAYNDQLNKYEYNIIKAKELFKEAGWELKTVALKIQEKETETETTTEDSKETDEEVIQEEEITTPEKVNNENENNNPGKKWMIKNNQILTIELSVLNIPEDQRTAQAIAEEWEKIGVKTNIITIDSQNAQSQIITSKDFTVVLYTILSGVDPDPYPFWHSTQIKDGFNLTSYKNTKVDKLLETARLDNNFEKRKASYIEFQQILTDDIPTIFLYSSKYTYVQNKKIKGFTMETIVNPEDRLSNINNWYIKESKKVDFK